MANSLARCELHCTAFSCIVTTVFCPSRNRNRGAAIVELQPPAPHPSPPPHLVFAPQTLCIPANRLPFLSHLS